jgi:eukaryotic-like serine/threonine-protein kinase
MPENNSDRKTQLDSLLQKVLELPQQQRDTFLNNATVHDPTLIDDVKKLLLYYDESESFLGDTVSDFLSPLLDLIIDDRHDSSFTFAQGTPIGNYRIEKLIGHGGMGQVYLAERDDGTFTKKVALKCIKKGMDSEEILKRFKYERQILAGLQHPNIAQLYDGGLTPDGRPYIVMEYIDGEAIHSYCDRLKLNIDSRLKLYRTVCSAVQYAHQKLVVHRDLKPSNILVTEKGEVKLLDFGIARILDDNSPDQKAPVTREGYRLMTPEYAAPEQIQNLQITTATDIYSLGVLLSELLSGEVSYRKKRKKKESQQSEPASSTAVSAVRNRGEKEELREKIATNRSTTPEKLKRKLKGDLNTIIQKAMKSDPAERYSSVAEFSNDINNYLTGLPVTATRDSARYRLGKFVRRNKTAVTSATAIILMIILFAVSTAMQQSRTSRALQIAEFERETAEEVASFLENLFSAANPIAYSSERQDTMTVRQLLEIGEKRIQEEFSDRPAIRARMLVVIGRAVRSLGFTERSIPMLEESVTIYRSLGTDYLDGYSKALSSLGNSYLTLERNEEAEELFREELKITRSLFIGDHERVITSLNSIGSSLQNQLKLEESAHFHVEALEMMRRLPEIDTLRLANLLNTNAILAYRQNDLETAITFAKEALDINRSILGTEHPRIGREMNNLAFLLNRSGRSEEAIPIFREMIELNIKLLGEEHPFVYTGMGNLADAMSSAGRTDEAIETFQKALDLIRNRPERDDPGISIMMANFASLLAKTGDYEAAENYYLEVIENDSRQYGDENFRVAIVKGKYGSMLCKSNRIAAGKDFLQEAIVVLHHNFPSDHPRVHEAEEALIQCDENLLATDQ